MKRLQRWKQIEAGLTSVNVVIETVEREEEKREEAWKTKFFTRRFSTGGEKIYASSRYQKKNSPGRGKHKRGSIQLLLG